MLLNQIEKLKEIKNIDEIFKVVSSGLQELGINPIISIIDNTKEKGKEMAASAVSKKLGVSKKFLKKLADQVV